MNGRVMKVVKFATDTTDLTHIRSGLSRLAEGDIAGRIETPFGPAFEKLRVDFNVARDNLCSSFQGSPRNRGDPRRRCVRWRSSAEAAKEIKAPIQASSSQIANEVKLVANWRVL